MLSAAMCIWFCPRIDGAGRDRGWSERVSVGTVRVRGRGIGVIAPGLLLSAKFTGLNLCHHVRFSKRNWYVLVAAGCAAPAILPAEPRQAGAQETETRRLRRS